MLTQDAINRERAAAERKLAELEAEQEKLDRRTRALTPAQNLAEIMHERLCHFNHTDGCDWYYRDPLKPDTWNQGTHQRYLDKAEAALQVADAGTITRIMQIIR